MYDRGKSDRPIVPKKATNKRPAAAERAEWPEGRGLTKGNTQEQNSHRTQRRERLQSALMRIRQIAEKDKDAKFTTLWHHVYDLERLEEAYYGLKRKSATGVDGETWASYGRSLRENLQDLSDRLARGAYHAKPVRRVYIPKADGKERPIGIPALEDKIVQSAASQVLGAIYEADFKGFSYGFRPGRSQHDALDAVVVGIERGRVNWILDMDIRSFFDRIDHDRLIEMVRLRVADERVIRHIKKWLNAGVMEDGEVRKSETGTPQGGSISPLLANIYLHYALDIWSERFGESKAWGGVQIVRYADDVICGFERREDAERYRSEVSERLAKFGLELSEEKTRLIEFGRFASANREKRGEGKPETFDFLGFTHICGKTKAGRYAVVRKTKRKKLQAKLQEIRKELKRRMHETVESVGAWLASVLRGHYAYYGVPRNLPSMRTLRDRVTVDWKRALGRRSQKGRITWDRMRRLIGRWLPVPKITHPYPNQRLRVTTQGRSPVR